jgi:chorismate mutase
MAAAMTALEDLRAGVDQVDREIQRLVGRRRELSVQIQSLRLRRGGARQDLVREELVVAAYERELGPEGAELAGAVLRLCRGPVEPAARPRVARPEATSG